MSPPCYRHPNVLTLQQQGTALTAKRQLRIGQESMGSKARKVA